MAWQDLPPIEVSWRGTVPYAQALAAQRARRDALLAGQDVPEVLWLLEHPAVLTTGLRKVADLPEPAFWQARGIEVHRVERGGLATLHAPGQLVAYLIARLTPRRLAVKGVIAAMEQAMIGSLAEQGVEANLRPGLPGVWVGRDKIGSVGLHVRHGVTLHGLALNLTVDLEPYTWFSPCGVQDGGTTSLLALRGVAPTPSELAMSLGDRLLWSLYESSVDSPAGDR